ncbi:DDE-domain-containing protein [Dendrothele bispora CBS 962.96]|uniref:DDE-domain-containing protein n=1 Tax=Dendrothele bispora (strain CBS 962.96) TaxID=1314807 RepID=A0A4S8MDD7_DENBC|nr:DDE-domain-containing protein [Dendrothele bispora CBS 962.96]
MDKTNCPRGNLGKDRVAGGAGKKTQHQQGGADKEMVTAIVTICADGTTLQPTIIFKGSNLWEDWCQNNIANAIFAVSLKGWTDSQIAIEWIKTVFDPATQEKSKGRPRVLLMDGHSSHFTESVIQFGLSVKIVILGYPPHCTHALQGLDVVCFAKMKTEMKKAVAEFEASNQHPVKKRDFTGVFGKAFVASFTQNSVLAAFKATGIHPFDPSVIKPEQMMPAEAKSVKGSFALQQTSPIKAITKSFRTYVPSTFDLDPSHAQAPEQPVASSSRITLDTPKTPQKPATSSAFFLTSKTPYTSDTPFPRLLQRVPADVPEPDWSLIKTSANPGDYIGKEAMGRKIEQLTEALECAKRVIEIAGENEETWAAQSVLQDMTLVKMNKVIHSKEEEKAARKNQSGLALPGPGEGYGCIWTDEAILDYKRKKREEEERETEEKKQKAKEKEDARARKVALETEWKDIMEKHHSAVHEWEECCERLKKRGVKRKEWPKKPTHISKKDLTEKRLGKQPSHSENSIPNDINNEGNDQGVEDSQIDCEGGFDEED